MAYKFQRGPAVASGSFTAEEGLTSNNALSVTAGTSTLQAVSAQGLTATTLSASSTLQAGGALTAAGLTTLNGGLAVTGFTTITGSTIISGAAGLSVIGLVSGSGGLQIGAAATIGTGLTVTAGNIVASSGIVSSSTAIQTGGNIRAINPGSGSISGITLTASLGSTLAATIVTTITGSGLAQFESLTVNGGGAATLTNAVITGGTINGTTIGATTQSSVKATTLSASSTLIVDGATTLNNGLTVSSGDSSVQKLTVNGDLIVLGNTFSASVGTLLIEDAAIVIGDGSTAFGTGYGINFGSGSNQWATLLTAQANIDGVAGNENVLSSSLAIKAPAFAGTLYGTMASPVTLVADAGTLAIGVNYFANVAGASSVTLPAAPSVGESVRVKAPSNCNTTNTITINKAGSQTIDGEAFIVLESSFAAVEFVYVAENLWRIF